MSTPNPATTEWVPLWDLEGGVDLRYRGEWAAGSYTDGDIVVYQGVSYMCVRPTSAPPVAWPPSVQVAPSYGTSLPASPVNGQEHVLVDSVSNPSYQWRFRYNVQSSSPYKWEFVGGPPLHGYGGATVGVVSSHGWLNLTNGPLLTAPRAGDYMVGWGARALNGGTFAGVAAHWVGLVFSVAGTPQDLCTVATAQYGGSHLRGSRRQNGVTVGETVRIRVSCNAANSPADFTEGELELLPVRVS